MIRFLAFLLLAAAVCTAPAAAQDEHQQPKDTTADWLELPEARLQGLDKVTARISTFEAPVGATVNFGPLEITTRTCKKRPPEDEPESAAFLEIVEVTPDNGRIEVFSGWMFASSPALSAMDHGVYDVWVLDCVDPKAEQDNKDEG